MRIINAKGAISMKTLIQIFVATAVMLGAAFGVAHAQQAPSQDMTERAEHGGKHHGGHGKRGERGMRIIDANGDGVISADEAASMADFAFYRLDDDRDGALTEAEFIGGPRGPRGWFGWNSEERSAVEKVRKDKFASLDLNKDAKLDKTEFFNEAKAKLAEADADKDGKVTPWEFRAVR
jgi:Ca2+-binding EF-hand superfamily protein